MTVAEMSKGDIVASFQRAQGDTGSPKFRLLYSLRVLITLPGTLS